MCDHPICNHHSDISRRGFAGLTAALGASLALLPKEVLAQEEPVGDTLCLMCIDHRYAADAIEFFDVHGKIRNYDLVSLAGASLAAIQTTNFPRTHIGLWEQVAFAKAPPKDATLKHPNVKNVIILDHMNCGAYHAQFPNDRDPARERRKHHDIAEEVGPMFVDKGLNTSIWLLDVYATPRESEQIWPLLK